MANNLGEISRLRDGLNGLYQLIESYKKCYQTTNITNTTMGNILAYYEQHKEILNNLQKKFNDLK